jgi:Rps23 Pro-64 3,4-dihydroxylase Tpa1-like proline 4-hydroxylase
MQFQAVNERKKVQISDASRFPPAVRKLHEALASPEFLADVSYITGIPRLLADPKLAGGGIHVTGPHGRLDVHVDFNLMEANGWHRRLNILVYLNPVWKPGWGGEIEL